MRPFAFSTTEISYPLCKFIQNGGAGTKIATEADRRFGRDRPLAMQNRGYPVGGHTDGERKLVRAHVSRIELRPQHATGMGLHSRHRLSPRVIPL